METYGCVAGYPNGTFRGNRAMTRYEAAALLNACLDRITEVTDELRRLLKEFETELAILKGRVDGLEARVGELEATQFSTTTKLSGKSTFVFGASRGYSNVESRADDYNSTLGGTSFNYDLQLSLDTSFTGKDLLRTRLRAGNFGESVFGTGLTTMETAFSSDNSVQVDRLFYSFPVGENFTVVGGPVVRQDDMLAMWPSAYPSDTVLDVFTYAGAPGAYNLALGAGAGLSWSDNGWSISANYVSTNGESSDPSGVSGSAISPRTCGGGIATDCAGSNGTVQLGYSADQWGVAATYTYASGNNGAGVYGGNGTIFAADLASTGGVNSYGLSAYWAPEQSGWIPSISTGWGLSQSIGWNGDDNILFSSGPYDGYGVDSFTSQSWYVGLEWSDVFIEGNSAGMAVGQPTFVTSVDFDGDYPNSDFIDDGNFAWEWWYQFQVTDNISVTPAIFYLSRPRGQSTSYGSYLNRDDVPTDYDDTFSNFGGLIKTTFLF